MKTFLKITQFIGFGFLTLLLGVSLIVALRLFRWFAVEAIVVAILIGLAIHFVDKRMALFRRRD